MMLPVITSNNGLHVASRNAESFCQLDIRDDMCKASDFICLLLIQLVSVATSMIAGRQRFQMVRAYATWILAFVVDVMALWDRTVCFLVGFSMGGILASNAVPTVSHRQLPIPTACYRIDNVFNAALSCAVTFCISLRLTTNVSIPGIASLGNRSLFATATHAQPRRVGTISVSQTPLSIVTFDIFTRESFDQTRLPDRDMRNRGWRAASAHAQSRWVRILQVGALTSHHLTGAARWATRRNLANADSAINACSGIVGERHQLTPGLRARSIGASRPERSRAAGHFAARIIPKNGVIHGW